MNSLQPPSDQDFVIVGATGDLARRKLLPALYNLCLNDLLPRHGQIIGHARREMSDDDFRAMARDAVREFSRTGLDEQAWRAFESRLTYEGLGPDGLDGVVRCCGQAQRLVYLATPPESFIAMVRSLGRHDLHQGARLIIEKPFGTDRSSARVLNDAIHEVFDESQVFRIDHYLGKETVQNILAFRFGNSIWERVWHRDAVEHVQITVAEAIGIEGRGAFYDGVGAVRDIIQSHVLQMLALITMEPPVSSDDEKIRDEKAKVLHAARPVAPEDVVFGQYDSGAIGGERVPGYRDEAGVAADSTTETFAAMRMWIDSWRWSGVPFYLRTGKRMPRRATEVEIAFREAPLSFFDGTAVERLRPNHLTIEVQPNEGIALAFLAKEPGPEVRVKPVHMGFSYEESFMTDPAEAYERLIHDAMRGDRTLFVREDSIDLAWQVVQPLLDAPPDVCRYVAGTWGPDEAADLIAPRSWHLR